MQSNARYIHKNLHRVRVPSRSRELVFLGIELDTVGLQLRLPSEKLVHIEALIQSWPCKKVASKGELQSLIGHLSHAATVVKPGRTFMRHLIKASKVSKQASLWVHLNINCRADLAWWELFIELCNGHAIMPSHATTSLPFQFYSTGSKNTFCRSFNPGQSMVLLITIILYT